MNHFTGGRVKIANDILIKITREAALEVNGVHEVVNGQDFVSYDKFATSDTSKGVKIGSKDGQLRIDVRVVAETSHDLAALGEKIQQNIVDKMQVITGLTVVEVNVYIESVAKE